jgi:nicotinate-nucleotide adenylyltransferase
MSDLKQRIGIFGGTFDPVHLGHLIMAEQCREQGQLDQVWFIPAARPPHKQDRPLTGFVHRAEMLALAIAGMPAFRIDDLEKDRPGPSYTAETLQELQGRFPDKQFALLLGSDCIPDLPGWKNPARIMELAELLVFSRPGWPLRPVEEVLQSLGLASGAPLRLRVVPAPLVDISSRDLRQRIAEHRSVRFLVPRAVECYIEEKKLYRTQ